MKARTTVVAAGAALLAAACSTAPTGPNQAVESARSTYQAAAADPHAAGAAPLELSYAAENLRRAEAAWQNGRAAAEVEHLAYLARQQSLIARERGRLAQAQAVIESARAERNELLLQSRQQALQDEGTRLALARRRAAAAEGVAAADIERAARMEQALREMAAKQTPLGMVMTLGDVLFDVGKTTLKPGAARTLDRLADFMRQYPERKARIEGFTDDTGPAELNRELSRERARAVREELIGRGIDGDRVEAVGYGAAFPVASNANPAGRQQNRRVEIVFSDENGHISGR